MQRRMAVRALWTDGRIRKSYDFRYNWHIASGTPGNRTDMRHHIGIALQLIALVFLPMLCLWQLTFGFKLIWMPASLIVGFVVFTIGTRLREA